MIKRIVTAAILIIIMALGIWFQGWPLRVILLISMLMSTSEMYRAFRRINYDPVRWSGYVYCVLAVLAQAYYATLNDASLFSSISPAMFALIIGLLLAMTVIVFKGKVAFDSLVSTVFPMLYPGLFFSLIITLQDLNTRTASTLALILTFFIASVNDTFALFIGLRFGKHKLSPEISKVIIACKPTDDTARIRKRIRMNPFNVMVRCILFHLPVSLYISPFIIRFLPFVRTY